MSPLPPTTFIPPRTDEPGFPGPGQRNAFDFFVQAPAVLVFLAVFCMALPIAVQAADDADADVEASRTWEDYRETVVVGNIFSRERGRPAEPEPADAAAAEAPVEEAEPDPPRDPGDDFVLRGVSYVGDVARAFFEDRRDSTVRVLIAGDTLAGRRLVSLSLDAVQLEPDGDPFADDASLILTTDGDYAIEVGHTLTGGEARPAPTAAAPDAEPESAPEPAADSDAEAEVDETQQSIIERMRRRREQQLDP